MPSAISIIMLACFAASLNEMHKAEDRTVSVAAAISLKDALSDVASAYEQQSGRKVHFTFGASGELATQIQQGGAIDLFISAAHKQVDDLVKAAVVPADAPQPVVARNALVLIVPADAKDPPQRFVDLADPKFARIAIGEPRSVPAGDYAMQVFESLKLADTVKPRLVFATNARQVLSYVERGEVPAGVVYRTDAAASKSVRIVETADEKLHKPIEYPAVVIPTGKDPVAGKEFLNFLLSDKGQSIIESRGFGRADQKPTTNAK
jgi:molybdate transport system substrate-binding protein